MDFSLSVGLEWMNVFHTAELDSEIRELLEEFEAVVEEMTTPSVSTHGAYEPVLNAAKQRPGFSDGVTDSGIEDVDDGQCSIISFPLQSQIVEGIV